MKKLIYFLFLFSYQANFAQIDLKCNGRDLHSIYLVGRTPLGLYRIDSVDTNPTNPILVTSNLPSVGGISINNNLDSLTGSQTIYFVGGNGVAEYYFWNGTSWTNTGNTAGSANAANPGGTSNYIFNYDGLYNSVYRYDGTGNGTLLISNLNVGGTSVYDLATDNQGNFYLFYTNLQQIFMYNSNGIVLDSISTAGFPIGIHPGFAILGNNIYALANNGLLNSDLYEGIKTGNTVNFSLIKNIAMSIADLATCPEAGNRLSIFKQFPKPRLSIYPNPVKDELKIKLDNNGMATIIFYDVYSNEILNQKITNKSVINTSAFADGVYFYEIFNEEGLIDKGKFVKQN